MRKARRVPELGAEIPVARNAVNGQPDITPLRGLTGEREAERVRAERLEPVRIGLARDLFDLGRVFRVFEPARAFGDQRVNIHTINQVERVDRIADRFGHFLTVLIQHQRVDIDIAERHLLREFQPLHHHPRDPEKDDVKGGHKDGGRVEFLEVRIFGVGPTQRGERPETGGEPGV